MKKIFAIMLVSVCVFALVACDKEDDRTIEEVAESMTPILGVGHDNPETSIEPNFDYLHLPDGFKVVSYKKCGITIDKPYVFLIEDENHRDRQDCHSIIFRENGAADIYMNDVFYYTTMGGIYQYGDGVIFNMVTGHLIYVKSENEIVFSKNGVDYIGVLDEDKIFSMDYPSFDDKYICVKDDVVYAYQFKDDNIVDYYENDVLIETVPYHCGNYAVGFNYSVYCLSRDNVALFIGEDIYTLGGVEYEIPPRGVKYPTEGSDDDPADVYLSDSDSLEGSEEEPVTVSAYKNAAYTLADYVVVDNEICTFIIKSIDPNGDWGFVLNVFCENKTDKTLEFYWDNVSVMGFTVSPVSGMEVAAGKKANGFVQFSYHDLDQIGMQSLDDITFTLRITDDEFWSADDPILAEEYAIYPTGKNIQDISYPTRKTTDNEVFLYDTDEYSAIILSSETDGNDFLIHYYLENKTDHEIIFHMDYAYVNGYMVDPRWGISVAAGKKMYDTVCFEDYLLDEHGISAVEQIMLSLRVLNADSMDAHATDVFSYIP